MGVRRRPGPGRWVATVAQAVFSQRRPAPPSPTGRPSRAFTVPTSRPRPRVAWLVPPGLQSRLLSGMGRPCSQTPPLNCLTAESPGRSSVLPDLRGSLCRWTCNLPGLCLRLSRHGSLARPGVWPLPSLPTALGTTEPYGYYLGPRADALPRLILGTAGSGQARSEDRARGREAQRGFPGWQGPREEGGLRTRSLKWGLQPLPQPRVPGTPSLG